MHTQFTSLRRVLALALTTLSVAAGVPATADAYTANCSWPRCALYLNRAETRAFATSNWKPAHPAVKVVYAGLRPIAAGWMRRGYCVAYIVSLVPWETQGMLGWRC